MVSRAMRGVSRLLPQNAFARGVSVLAGGTAGAQLLMVLAAPLLTRLYSPEDFGLLAVYVGLLSLFTVVASLRYELAIPLPESDLEAANIVVLSLLVVCGMAIVTLLVVIFVGDAMARALGVPELAKYIWLLPVGVFFIGIYQVFNYWAIRTKLFATIARTRIRQALTTLGIQILCFKAGSVALLLGQAGGEGMGSMTLAKTALSRPELRHWTWKGVGHAAGRYREFPLFASWSGFFNTAGRQLPPLMFAAFFSAGAAGLYTLAHRVLAMPMAVVGQAVGKVFFANAAEAYREGRLGPLVSSVHDKLAQIAMPPALILFVAGPDLFALLFGEQWRQAGEFARWMAPWLYMVFITSPLSMLFTILEKQRQGLIFQTILLLARIGAIGLGAMLADLHLAVMLFSSASALCLAGFLIWVAFSTGNTLAMVLRPTIQSFGVSVVCVFPLWLGLSLHAVSSWWLLSVIISGLLVLARYWKLFRKAY